MNRCVPYLKTFQKTECETIVNSIVQSSCSGVLMKDMTIWNSYSLSDCPEGFFDIVEEKQILKECVCAN